MKNKILILSTAAILAFAALYYYLYKSHRDVTSEKAQYSLSTKQISQEFQQNAAAFNKKYIDKAIQISGTVTKIDPSSHNVMIDGKISASFEDTLLTNVKLLKNIQVKGRYIGYDDLTEEFNLDHASLSH